MSEGAERKCLQLIGRQIDFAQVVQTVKHVWGQLLDHVVIGIYLNKKIHVINIKQAAR